MALAVVLAVTRVLAFHAAPALAFAGVVPLADILLGLGCGLLVLGLLCGLLAGATGGAAHQESGNGGGENGRTALLHGLCLWGEGGEAP